MSKKILRWAVFPVILIVIAGAYPGYRVISKISTDYKVTQELRNNGYEESVETKQVVFDSKTGRYIVEVRFKDEAQYLYAYDVIDGEILTIIYDSNNGSVDPDEGTKYYLR